MIALHKNPPAVFPEESSVRNICGTWWVAHTRSRHEKALAFDLLKRRDHYFLPLVEKSTIVRRRRFRSLLPLFPGYLFFAGDSSVREWIFTTDHVANVIPVRDQARLVSELHQLQTALASPVQFDPFPHLKRGSRCRIRSGSLRGIEGLVVKRAGISRIVLQIEMLGQAVAAEVDPADLERVD